MPFGIWKCVPEDVLEHNLSDNKYIFSSIVQRVTDMLKFQPAAGIV